MRNILIGIIALVIAVSACISLSIKEAVAKTKEDTLESLTITSSISYDRSKQMEQMKENADTSSTGGGFDKSAVKELLGSDNSLSLDELQKYSKADSVKNFYYTLTASLDASDSFEAIDTTGQSSSSSTETTTSSSSATASTSASQSSANAMGGNMPGGDMGGGKGRMGQQGDFSVIGVSDDSALTDFGESGTCSITDGAMFDEGTEESVCVINSELATYNSVEVGDTITLTNPNNDEETVKLKGVGIYTNSAASDDSMAGFNPAADSANKIYMSYTALKSIADTSESNNTSSDDSESTAIKTTLSGTYVFADNDNYEKFCEDVYTLGLSEDYTVSSSDITSFEQSIEPLENLSSFATYFLIVVFAIGAIILVVLKVINIPERKYEIGVLTAIGMKKVKVAMQFVTELFIVTLAAMIIGAGIGAATSVPVTNALLSAQIESNQSKSESVKQNFGRDTNMGQQGMMEAPGGMGGMSKPDDSDDSSQSGGKGGVNPFESISKGAASYISSVSYSTDLTVILQLIGVGILLTLISSLVSVSFIMRYEPLKILSERD